LLDKEGNTGISDFVLVWLSDRDDCLPSEGFLARRLLFFSRDRKYQLRLQGLYDLLNP
jgi:hypothetical protein